MATEKPLQTFTKAVITTATGRLPDLVQYGGEQLLRHLQIDPGNISGICSVIQIVSQAMLPEWALEAHHMWAILAEAGAQTHSLARDAGIDKISELQSTLAAADGFSQAIFVVSNLGAALGIPKLAAVLVHLENPSLKIKLGDEAQNIVTSMYSASAVHTQAQQLICELTDELEGMIAPLYASSERTRSPQEIEQDVWAFGRSPDTDGDLKGKLLVSIMSLSRFGTPATPIQYPLVINHLSYVVSLAVIFDFALEFQGKVVYASRSDYAKKIVLVHGGAFQEGEEIVADIRSLVKKNEKKEGEHEYLNLRDLQHHERIDLSAATKGQMTRHASALRQSVALLDPCICRYQQITKEAVTAVLRYLDETMPNLSDGEEETLSRSDIEGSLVHLIMIEIVRGAVSGQVLTLCAVKEEANASLPYQCKKLIELSANDWSDNLWGYLAAFNPMVQTANPYGSIVGGQAGVILPSLLLVETEASLLGCAAPLTILPGVLTVRGRRQDLLNESIASLDSPLKDEEVQTVAKATCIWRNVHHIFCLQGANLTFSYKVYAKDLRITISLATQAWLYSITSEHKVAQEAAVENVSAYICRNVDSTPFESNLPTVWLAKHSIAGKLLVLCTLGSRSMYGAMDRTLARGSDGGDWTSVLSEGNNREEEEGLDNDGDEPPFRIYLAHDQAILHARQKAAALGCQHILI